MHPICNSNSNSIQNIQTIMGNDQSTVIDEERRMLEDLYQISEGRLDSGDHNNINSAVNSGTSAPNCQPSHTVAEIKEEEKAKKIAEEIREAERLAGLLDINDSEHRAYLEAKKQQMDSSTSSHSSQQQQQPEKGSLGSYVQMAKTGYQELVNAIIR